MTEAASQSAELLAVHSVDEFVFSAPSLDEARHFYTSFGLDVRDVDGGLGLYTHGHTHRWARVLPGASKRLLWLSLGIHATDAQRFERRLAERGVARIDAPSSADPGGIWIQSPDGLAIQLRVGAKSSPSAPAPREFPPECANVGVHPAGARHKRCAHCTFRTSCCSVPMSIWRGTSTKTSSA